MMLIRVIMIQGEYSVALPDGRIQYVTYHADGGYGGTVMEVSYKGEARHPEAVHSTPVVHDVVSHGVSHGGVSGGHIGGPVGHIGGSVGHIGGPVGHIGGGHIGGGVGISGHGGSHGLGGF